MNRVAIVGGGTMGAGIAQVAVTNGWRVDLLERDEQLAQKAVEQIKARIDRQVEKHKLTAADGEETKERLHIANSPQQLDGCHFVIEAIFEDMAAKVKILSEVRDAVGLDVVFASNTSSLSISDLGQRMGIAPRVCGMHFFNPAPLMPLVEVIAGSQTDPSTIDYVTKVAEEWGKPVVRVKDTPGFIVNRVARPYYLESLRILEQRLAGCDSVDVIMREVGGFKMGPFELMDLVGIDVNFAVTQSVYEQSGRPSRFKPSEVQQRLVGQNKLGRKTGMGFFDYQHEHPELSYRIEVESMELPGRIKSAYTPLAESASWDIEIESGYVFARILTALINEAALVHQEGVASEEDIDVAMKLGTNYPKGLLTWGNELGHDRVGAFLRALNASVDDNRFEPAQRFMS